MRGPRLRFAVIVAILVSSCGAPSRPHFPEGEDYLFPASAPGELRPEEARRLESAWKDVLAGDAPSAQRAFQKLLARRPGLVAAATGEAYARLRAGRFREASAGFAAVLARKPAYLPALVGAGSAAVRRSDPEAALELYRRAQALSPRDATVLRRLAEVKLQVTERRVAAARAALAAGETEAAVEAYRRALEAAPELGALRVETANILVDRGDLQGAIDLLAADPARDRQVGLRLGELATGRGDFAGALEAYRRVLAREPGDAEALRRAMEARQSLELAQMPPEYRQIFGASRISRADLAALVCVKVSALSRVAPGDPQVAVDISGSWARDHILKALSYDILEVYSNHTFQPAATLRRGDLARAVARVLDLLKAPGGPPPLLKDISESNLFHDVAVRVVAAGLMDTTPDGAFEPWRPVSGHDAVAVVEALARLVGP
jgi:tetratricopeptide (TPR) repeat protein